MYRDTLLSIDDIAADELAGNIVWTIRDLWRQNARDILITSEQTCRVGRGGKAGTGEIVIIGLESLQGGEVAAGFERRYCTSC